jgi:hypothetical protein
MTLRLQHYIPCRKAAYFGQQKWPHQGFCPGCDNHTNRWGSTPSTTSSFRYSSGLVPALISNTLFREEASDAQADRRELITQVKDLAPGDVVTVTRIDRLACSPFDLFAIVKRIEDAGGQFRSLAEPLADTSTSPERLLIAVLGGLAERDPSLPNYRNAASTLR